MYYYKSLDLPPELHRCSMKTKSKQKGSIVSQTWRDNPENRKKTIWIFFGLCGAVLLIDLVFSLAWHKHAAFSEDVSLHALETLPGFYGLFGFLTCGGLVVLAKFMREWRGKKILMRKEDYWES